MSVCPCVICGKEQDPNDPSIWTENIGWAKPKQFRSGGLNNLKWRKNTGRVMCGPCGFEKENGINREQESLW